MPAVRQQARLAAARHAARHAAQLQQRAVLVMFALQRQDRHAHAGQADGGIHRLEARGQPGVVPQPERLVHIAAVIALETRAQVTGYERVTRMPDAGHGALLVHHVGTDRDDAAQHRRLVRRIVERHGTAVAVADQQAGADPGRVEHFGQYLIAFDLHVACARRPRPSVGLAVTGAVVGKATQADARGTAPPGKPRHNSTQPRPSCRNTSTGAKGSPSAPICAPSHRPRRRRSRSRMSMSGFASGTAQPTGTCVTATLVAGSRTTPDASPRASIVNPRNPTACSGGGGAPAPAHVFRPR